MTEADKAPPDDDVVVERDDEVAAVPEGDDGADVATPQDVRAALYSIRAALDGKGNRATLEEAVRDRVALALDLVDELETPAAPALEVPLDTPDAHLTAALAAAQGAFPSIEKRNTAVVPGKNGKQGYSYTYADLAEVLAAVRPVCAAHGIAIVQRTNRDGVLRTELRHVRGGVVDSEVDLGQSSSSPQQFGGALTYLRRYELVTLLGIAAEEDRDAQDVEPAGRARPAPPQVQVPAWAAPATAERKARVAEVLAGILGGDVALARRYAATLTAEAGAFPAVVAWWLGTLPDWIQAAADRAGQSEEERKADDVRREQDTAAERPDEPAAMTPELAAERARERAAAAGALPVTDEPLPAGASRSPRADDPRYEEPVDDPPPDLDGDGSAEDTTDPPGSVDNPFAEATELDEDAIAALRVLGCVCSDPSVELGRVDECPIRGHGIPF